MTTAFPPKPWNEGATFTNDITGVTYTYSGGKWLASGGPKVEGEYLPLTGGKLEEPGNLTVEGQLKVSTGSELKVEYDDGTNMVRVRPDNNSIALRTGVINTKDTLGSLSDRVGLEVQVSGEKPLAISNSGSYQSTLEIYGYDGASPDGRKRQLFITAGGNVNTEGNVNAQSFVKGSELRSTKLTSGQSSNLQIYRGSGENEERKMLIGTDSVNLDVSLKLVGSQHKNIQVQSGTKIDTGGDEIITFGGSGAFYRGVITQPDHMVNREYVWEYVDDVVSDYLPLTGGDMQGNIQMDFDTCIDGRNSDGQNYRMLQFRGGYGLEYKAATNNEYNVINRKAMVAYVDDAIANVDIPDVDLSDYLPLTGGNLSGSAQRQRQLWRCLWH